MPLTGPAARKLRALAHKLTPVVHVGKHGATEEAAAAVARALLDHELIKIKVLREAPESPDAIGEALASMTSSDVAQRIGRIVVMYKPHPKKAKIKVPAGYTAPPKRPKPTPAASGRGDGDGDGSGDGDSDGDESG